MLIAPYLYAPENSFPGKIKAFFMNLGFHSHSKSGREGLRKFMKADLTEMVFCDAQNERNRTPSSFSATISRCFERNVQVTFIHYRIECLLAWQALHGKTRVSLSENVASIMCFTIGQPTSAHGRTDQTTLFSRILLSFS